MSIFVLCFTFDKMYCNFEHFDRKLDQQIWTIHSLRWNSLRQKIKWKANQWWEILRKRNLTILNAWLLIQEITTLRAFSLRCSQLIESQKMTKGHWIAFIFWNWNWNSWNPISKNSKHKSSIKSLKLKAHWDFRKNSQNIIVTINMNMSVFSQKRIDNTVNR